MNIGHIVVFWVAWLLFVAAQAQNSIRSNTNGLSGWKGFTFWLKAHAINLAHRIFWSAVGCGSIIHYVSLKVLNVGLPVTATMIAAAAGYLANGLLYQIFGFIPGLRVEVADLAPPANSQIVSSPPTQPS